MLLFPLTALCVATEMLARQVGLLPPYAGIIEPALVVLILCVFLILGIPLLIGANKLLQFLEGSKEWSCCTHIRQSLCWYILLAWSAASWTRGGFGNTEEDGYLLIWISSSALAVIVNAIYLRKTRT